MISLVFGMFSMLILDTVNLFIYSELKDSVPDAFGFSKEGDTIIQES